MTPWTVGFVLCALAFVAWLLGSEVARGWDRWDDDRFDVFDEEER